MSSTLRGMGIRGVLLVIGAVVLGIWLLSLALKIAGAAIHILLVLGLILVVIGAFKSVARGLRRR